MFINIYQCAPFLPDFLKINYQSFIFDAYVKVSNHLLLASRRRPGSSYIKYFWTPVLRCKLSAFSAGETTVVLFTDASFFIKIPNLSSKNSTSFHWFAESYANTNCFLTIFSGGPSLEWTGSKKGKYEPSQLCK